MARTELGAEDLKSIRTSFLNITSLFLGKQQVESRYVGCLMKWAVQLQFRDDDLRYIEENFDKMAFEMPETNEDKLNAIFNLVHMIYLDNVVEDIELEVASIYAEHLGFEKYVVSEVFQNIATAIYDGKTPHEVKNDIRYLIGL